MRALAVVAALWIGRAAGRREGRVEGEMTALRRLLAYELGETLRGRRGAR